MAVPARERHENGLCQPYRIFPGIFRGTRAVPPVAAVQPLSDPLRVCPAPLQAPVPNEPKSSRLERGLRVSRSQAFLRNEPRGTAGAPTPSTHSSTKQTHHAAEATPHAVMQPQSQTPVPNKPKRARPHRKVRNEQPWPCRPERGMKMACASPSGYFPVFSEELVRDRSRPERCHATAVAGSHTAAVRDYWVP